MGRGPCKEILDTFGKHFSDTCLLHTNMSSVIKVKSGFQGYFAMGSI